LAQDRDKWIILVNAVMNLQLPQNVGKHSSGYTIGGLSSSAQLLRVIQHVTICIVLYTHMRARARARYYRRMKQVLLI
jgi:hypothetical protein